MDALEIERAHLVGNSLGGRVAIEVGAAPPRARRGDRPAVPGRRLRQARPAPARARSCAPSWGCCPHRFADGTRRRPVLEPVRRPRPGRPERRRHRRRRVPAHLPARRRAARLPRRGAQHLPRATRSGATASTRAWPTLRAARRCSSGAPHDQLIPPAFSRHVARVAARRRADRARRLRPRPPGRAPRPDQRRCSALLRAGRRARARRPLAPPRRSRATRLAPMSQTGIAEQALAQRARRRRARRRAGLAARLRREHRGRRSSAHPARRPRRARPRLHPRDPAAAVAAREPLLPRRGPRARATSPRTGRCCWSATTRAAT